MGIRIRSGIINQSFQPSFFGREEIITEYVIRVRYPHKPSIKIVIKNMIGNIRSKKELIVQDTIDMIPVGAQVPAKGTGERSKDVIDQWEGSAKIHGSALRLIVSDGGDKLLRVSSQPKIAFFLTAPHRY